MPDTAQWFIFPGRGLHAVNPAKTKRLTSYCGLVPMESDDIATMIQPSWEVPDGACSRCLIQVALGSTDDEPLEEAIRRGYTQTEQHL